MLHSKQGMPFQLFMWTTVAMASIAIILAPAGVALAEVRPDGQAIGNEEVVFATVQNDENDQDDDGEDWDDQDDDGEDWDDEDDDGEDWDDQDDDGEDWDDEGDDEDWDDEDWDGEGDDEDDEDDEDDWDWDDEDDEDDWDDEGDDEDDEDWDEEDWDDEDWEDYDSDWEDSDGEYNWESAAGGVDVWPSSIAKSTTGLSSATSSVTSAAPLSWATGGAGLQESSTSNNWEEQPGDAGSVDGGGSGTAPHATSQTLAPTSDATSWTGALCALFLAGLCGAAAKRCRASSMTNL